MENNYQKISLKIKFGALVFGDRQSNIAKLMSK